MNSIVGIRSITAILVCMCWCLPTPAQETILPAGRTAASSASPGAAARAILDVTQAANWAYRNRIALSIAAAGTAQSGNAAPQAEPFPKNAPARPAAQTPAKSRKRWTAARIGVLAAGVGLTGTGAYMLATGSKVPLPGGTGAPCDGLVHCVGTTVWDGKMKAGVWLLAFGAPLSLVGLL